MRGGNRQSLRCEFALSRRAPSGEPGDRESEARYLAEQVGITEIYAQKSPEDKLAIVRKETAVAKTLYVGDGINDAPAMMAARVGMAIGQNSDVTAEAAGVVIMDNSLEKVDEFMHISRRMRSIALQSAVGGMWHGAKRYWHGFCSDRSFKSGQRRHHSRGYRHFGCDERVAGRLCPQSDP